MNSTIVKNRLTAKEAAEYTGYALKYIYNLVSWNRIPYSKPNGGKLFFEREKLDQWLSRNTSMTQEEMEQAASTYVATH
jgi:prophage regulatory protein